MDTGSVGDATVMLGRIAAGDSSVAEQLLPIVYDELRALAGAYFVNQRVGHTLEPTALVHEAFLKLVGGAPIAWESRAHFFAVAAKAMRHVLADYARRVAAEKRGGDGQWSRITLSGVTAESFQRHIEAIELNEALEKLEQLDPRQAKIVEMRFLGGLRVAEVATLLDISERTVELDWRMARAWLRQQLAG